MYKRLPSHWGYSTVLPDIDYEGYSEAGYEWTGETWQSILGKGKKAGLQVVGATIYAEHPSTEVHSLAYNLKDGLGPRLWIPVMPNPHDLLNHVYRGGAIEAWNIYFEYVIWNKICVPKYDWPPLKIEQLYDAMAKSRAFALPGSLEKAGEILQIPHGKDKEGMRLIKKFCLPRKPTKKDPRKRILLEEDPVDAQKLYDYNLRDIQAESEISEQIPDLIPSERKFWIHTFRMNDRGVAVDLPAVKSCIQILEQAYDKYNSELAILTSGQITEASKGQQIQDWCASRGTFLPTLEDEQITYFLANVETIPEVRRVLEIRQLISSAGVKKVYAMLRTAAKDGRVHDLFIYHSARTGRDAGADVQPQNLVKAGIPLCRCLSCGGIYGRKLIWCPHCGSDSGEFEDWHHKYTDYALSVIASESLDEVERIFGNAVLTISGCIRGLFIAGPGNDLISSDYSSIEAVVTAILAGEQWRIDAFARGDDIYLASVAKFKGRSLEWYMQNGGKSHPDRQKMGKPAELGLGYGGWILAWRQFDKSDNYDDEEIKKLILAWRAASPAICELWGGQVRGKPWDPDYQEYYGLEGAAIQAVLNPGKCYSYSLVTYGVKNDILFCRLPSGRFLTYHQPRLTSSEKWEGQLQLSFMGWNTNPKMGPIGWVRLNTFGGRLAENNISAIARDVMAHGVNNLETNNYPIVLRVHDELVGEVPKGWGSIEEFEFHMGDLPPYAKSWPIRASGGWRGKRFRKD